MLAAFYDDRTAKCTAKTISPVLKDFADHYEMHQGNNQGNIFVLAAFYEDRTAMCSRTPLLTFVHLTLIMFSSDLRDAKNAKCRNVQDF